GRGAGPVGGASADGSASPGSGQRAVGRAARAGRAARRAGDGRARARGGCGRAGADARGRAPRTGPAGGRAGGRPRRRGPAARGCTVTLTPVRPGTGAPVMAVMALVMLLIEHSDPVALWFPHQDHITSPEALAADVAGGVLVHYRVHPTRAPAGMEAASTRG